MNLFILAGVVESLWLDLGATSDWPAAERDREKDSHGLGGSPCSVETHCTARKIRKLASFETTDKYMIGWTNWVGACSFLRCLPSGDNRAFVQSSCLQQLLLTLYLQHATSPNPLILSQLLTSLPPLSYSYPLPLLAPSPHKNAQVFCIFPAPTFDHSCLSTTTHHPPSLLQRGYCG